MKLERRRSPSRRALAEALFTAACVAVGIALWQGYTLAGKGLVAAVVLALLGAQVESLSTPRHAELVTAVLAYFVGRALEAPLGAPWNLDEWWPYEAGLCLAIFFQASALRPLVPIRVREATKLRSYAALFLVLGSAFAWRSLKHHLGPASACLVIAVVVVIALWSDSRYLILGILICAGFLAGSALVQNSGPTEILGSLHEGAIHIAFELRPPPQQYADPQGLAAFVNVRPDAPTVFQCPSAVYVSVFVTIPTGVVSSRRYNQLQTYLLHSTFVLGVTGATTITDDRVGARGVSHVARASVARGGVHTEYTGTGLHIGAPDGDDFSFALPLQHPRGMGSCFVEVPDVNSEPLLDAGPTYFQQPESAQVELSPSPGSSIDTAETAPTPIRDPNDPDSVDWTCYDIPKARYASSSGAPCPALAVINANWASAYDQTALIVVGALVAIAAERWFNRLGRRGGEGRTDTKS